MSSSIDFFSTYRAERNSSEIWAKLFSSISSTSVLRTGKFSSEPSRISSKRCSCPTLIGSILFSIITILTSVVTILASIEQVKTWKKRFEFYIWLCRKKVFKRKISQFWVLLEIIIMIHTLVFRVLVVSLPLNFVEKMLDNMVIELQNNDFPNPLKKEIISV